MEADPHMEPTLQEDSDVAEAAEAAPDTAEAPESELGEHTPPREMDQAQLLRLVEAILFASSEPLTLDAIKARLPKDVDPKPLLAELEGLYADRGVNIVRVAGKFMLRTAPDLVDALKIERVVKRKMSRASVETLAIIAYHQPVTRAEVEEIRGVELSRGTLDLLMEAGWIKPRGHRETPGRPALWVTTEQFLLHFGLDKLDDLPGVEDLKAAGLLDARPAVSAYSEEAGLTFADAPGESEEEGEGAVEPEADEPPGSGGESPASA
ncbi:MAG TPA: SMC-Scp complex subunit ScpB [Alphaproteobacteria bacterium]|nr:SMC-Scp complex subunit ScpB [Alphaproteobacteria bacterium]